MSTTLHVPVERYTLPNGLTVLLHEDHHVPNVVVDILFRVGSKDEKLGRSGFAHLFEHLMFMGTRNVPNGSFDTIMEGVGGHNNASTSEDCTNYFEVGPSNLLETFLWLEADRLSTLPDDMTKAKVDLQRDVVKNERRQSVENRPYGRVELEVPDKLYPKSHPYHHPVIGSHEDLDAARVDDVKAFFRQFYVPSNAVLVINGDFDRAQAKALIEKYFAWMPKKPVPPHASPKPTTLDKPVRVALTEDVQLSRVVMAWHSPRAFADGDADTELLAAVLGGGDSSRLFRALVYDQKLAESVEVDQIDRAWGSDLQITATAQSGHTSAEVEKAIDRELERLTKEPPTQAELDRARAYVQTRLLRAIESPVRLAEVLAEFELFAGDARTIDQRLVSRYDSLTVDGVRSWAKKVLGAPRLTIVIDPNGGAK
jgi:zinc protease